MIINYSASGMKDICDELESMSERLQINAQMINNISSLLHADNSAVLLNDALNLQNAAAVINSYIDVLKAAAEKYETTEREMSVILDR